MKNIFLSIFTCLICSAFGAYGQCPAVDTTFSVSIPFNASMEGAIISDVIENTANEMVGVGVIQGQSDFLYFIRTDGIGNPIGLPKRLSVGGGYKIKSGSLTDQLVYITEAIGMNGASDGYMVAVDVKSGSDPSFDGVLVLHLNVDGCVTWSRFLTEADNEELKVLGIHRNNIDDYVILTKVISSNVGYDYTQFFTINGSGTNCSSTKFNFIVPQRMIRLNQGVFGTAKWALCGLHYNLNNPPNYATTISLLDENFVETTESCDSYNPDVNKSSTPALGLRAIGTNIYMYGRFLNVDVPTTFWVMKISGIAGSYNTQYATNFNYEWTKELDLASNAPINSVKDIPFSMEVKNNQILICGATNTGGNAPTLFKPWLLALNENGNLVHAKIFDETSPTYGIASNIKSDASGGIYAVGAWYTLNGGNIATNGVWLAKVDDNLVIGDCQCNADLPFTVNNVVGGYVQLDDVSTESVACNSTPVPVTCMNESDTKSVCFQPSNPPICSVIISFTLNPCTLEATFFATPFGMGPNINFTWILPNGQTVQSGNFITYQFPSPGSYNITVLADDGTCTATADFPFVVTGDNMPPAIVSCPTNQTLTGMVNANGICSAMANNLTADAQDICSFTWNYQLAGATTGSGTGLPSNVNFLDGATTVQYTATDLTGNQAYCNFTISVDCLPINDCTPSCTANSLIVNTAYNPITNTLGTPGQYTSFWELTQSPNTGVMVPRAAYIVTPNPAWAIQTQSEWISAYPISTFNGNNPAPNPTYNFRNCFCVCADQTDVTIALSALVDNNLGIDLVTNAGTFIGNILNITATNSSAFTTPTVATKVFNLQKGNYCINAGLRNLSGVAMGFNIQGTVTGGGLLNSECCGTSNYITGQKYIDTDCNGTKDFLEMGAQGWTIQLKDSNGVVVASTTTDTLGYYSFHDFPAGTYTVMEVQQAGYTTTQPASGMYSATINGYDVIGGLDFGNCAACSVGFSSIQDPNTCYKVNFTGSSTGTAPFTYSWDFGCNGIVDATGVNPMFVFPIAGIAVSYPVCLTITDATGCTSSITKQVLVQPDLQLPILFCPANITLNTDPGQCCSTKDMSATAADNCSSASISYILTGATTGTNPNVCFNVGLTNITATAMDAAGNLSNCTYTVTVQDQQKPNVQCPVSQSQNVPACNAGAIFTFGLPTVTDNCPLPPPVNVTCTPASGFFFPLGLSSVTCTATDVAGNTNTCQFSVTVNPLCGSIEAAEISCTNDPKVFTFLQQVKDLTGSNGACTITATPTQPDVVISNTSTVWSGNLGTLSGTITVTGNCIPVNFFHVVQLVCQCPSGPISCDLPFTLDVPCCYPISVNDDEVCSKAANLSVPLFGCSALPDVQQVRWYVAYAPCPPIGDAAWGSPYQVTNGCDDLLLLPYKLSGNVCVYAEVLQGNCAGSCSRIYSNVANISLCAPFGCNIVTATMPYYCATNVPSTASFTVNYDALGCASALQWSDHAGTPLGTNSTLNVSGLSFAAAPITSPDGCWREYMYRATVTQPCSPQSCETRIRIYDDNASAGTLNVRLPDIMLPPIPPNLVQVCSGEDLQITYAPVCAIKQTPTGSPEWKWWTHEAGAAYAQLSTAGDMNPLHVTNKIYQDTWFKVTKQNGVCPEDEVEIFINVYEALDLGAFTTTQVDPCFANGILLKQNIAASSGCALTVKWYKDGLLIHASSATGTSATYTYVNAALDGNYAGNYYAVVDDNCCPGEVKSNVVVIGPPCKAVVLGPCFICKDEIVTLTGAIVHPPASGTCMYQWYIFNTVSNSYDILLGETNSMLSVNQGGETYRFEANCNGCVKTVDFFLKQCGTVGTNEPELGMYFLKIAPNPTTGALSVTLTEPSKKETWVQVINLNGSLLQEVRFAEGATTQMLDLEGFPSGMYLVRLRVGGKVVGVAKVVKE